MVLVKLLNDRARVPDAGRLYACADSDGDVRTGVSVAVPHGMRCVAQSPLLVRPCLVESGEEIVLETNSKVADGEHVGQIVFFPTSVVVEGDASELGPLA
jgi:hypothetical protein